MLTLSTIQHAFVNFLLKALFIRPEHQHGVSHLSFSLSQLPMAADTAQYSVYLKSDQRGSFVRKIKNPTMPTTKPSLPRCPTLDNFKKS